MNFYKFIYSNFIPSLVLNISSMFWLVNPNLRFYFKSSIVISKFILKTTSFVISIKKLKYFFISSETI